MPNPALRIGSFQGPQPGFWTRDRINAVLFLQTTHISGRADSMGCTELTREDNSPQTRLRRPPRIRWRYRPVAWARAGILTCFPFAQMKLIIITLVQGRLRADSPMSNCCSHGTLLLFSLQSSHLNICYYHQDLHRRPLHLVSQPRLRRNLRALLHIKASDLP